MTSCCWYHKGTIFQANHNGYGVILSQEDVVVDTTKVRFFKQITTRAIRKRCFTLLLLIPQRYDFSSKSQLIPNNLVGCKCCCWYHKGTIFQANHNWGNNDLHYLIVVVDTTKVRFFKQITSMCEGKYCYIQIEK